MTYTRLFAGELQILAQSGLSGSSILVYIALTKYDHTEDCIVHPKISTLLQDLDNQYHRSSVEKALRKLIDSGLIKRIRTDRKNRWQLIVRSRAIDEFEISKKVTDKGKSYSQGASNVTDKTRKGLRTLKKRKGNTLFLYKPDAEIISELIVFYDPGEWCHDFLQSCLILKARNQPLKGDQIKKYQALIRKHKGDLTRRESESGSEGERMENECESLPTDQGDYIRGDNPEIGKPTWAIKPSWTKCRL
jgi:predicted transcriptional regulator